MWFRNSGLRCRAGLGIGVRDKLWGVVGVVSGHSGCLDGFAESSQKGCCNDLLRIPDTATRLYVGASMTVGYWVFGCIFTLPTCGAVAPEGDLCTLMRRTSFSYTAASSLKQGPFLGPQQSTAPL